MKIHRFIVAFREDGGFAYIADHAVVRQLTKILRIKAGELIALSNAKKNEELIVRVAKINNSEVSGEIVERRTVCQESPVALYCAVLKKANFELVVQKATEIGVAKIVPVVTERTVKLDLNLKRIAKIALEAAEQSGRPAPPVIEPPTSFMDAVQNISSAEALFCDQGGGDSILACKLPQPASIAIFVGPEGGWSDRERAIASQKNMTNVSLGSLTLRAETAAIVGVYVLCARLT
jgi:16S rRNA (uracil1498-N3)-methyltransferase